MNCKFIYIIFLISMMGCKYYNPKMEKDSGLYFDTLHFSDNCIGIQTMKDTLLHGVSWQICQDDPYPDLHPELLYFNDELILDKSVLYSDKEYGYTVFYYADTIELIAGTWYYDVKTHKPIQKKCAYYYVEAPDTIKYGEPYQMVISTILGMVEDFDIQLKIGELKYNKDQEFIEIQSSTEYYGSHKGLHIELEYKKGINLITGIISFHSELLDNELHFVGPFERNTLIFYHQFYVD